MRDRGSSLINAPCDAEVLLGAPLDASPYALIRAYRKALAAKPHLREPLRIACKLALDDTYRGTFLHYGTFKAVEEAGFFDDGLEPGSLLKLTNPNWLVTPLDKLLRQLERLKSKPIKDAPRVVLLTTGAFAPVHEGHIAMMAAAWRRLSREGYAVLGGFFSSSHDAYVRTKGLGAEYYHASLRYRALNAALAGHDWLMADPWEALYTPCAINFTDVLRRLKNYLNRHITSFPPLEVAYVFGSDNATFSKAFVTEGLAVCVERPGYKHEADFIRQDRNILRGERVLFTSREAGEDTPDIQSSFIRKGTQALMPTIEKEVYSGHESQKAKARTPARGIKESLRSAPSYLIRNDVLWATQFWRGLIEEHARVQAATDFVQGLSTAIQESFAASYLKTHPRKILPIVLPIDAQKAAAYELCERTTCINNDILTAESGVSVGLSRLFQLSNPQFKADTLVERPESSGSIQTLSALKPQGYTLIDDDIASGFTLNALKSFLPEGSEVNETIPLSRIAFEQQCPNKPYEFWDIVDARDFLLGAYAGGLVVRLFNNQIARAPYISPYVSLCSRANIAPDQERLLSLQILQLNLDFFSRAGEALQLRHASKAFQNLIACTGFSPEDSLRSLCEWHIKQLRF